MKRLEEHNFKTCTERWCYLCGELAVAKRETIVTVRDKLCDAFWSAILREMTYADDTQELRELLRKWLVKMREIDPAELWD